MGLRAELLQLRLQVDVLVRGVAETRSGAGADCGHFDPHALTLDHIDESLKVPVAGDQAYNIEAIEHLDDVECHLDVDVGLDRSIGEPLERLCDDFVALAQEWFSEALRFDAYARIVVDRRVGGGPDECAAIYEEVQHLAPVDSCAQPIERELDVGGVHKHADTRGVGGRASRSSATFCGIFGGADQVLDLPALGFHYLDESAQISGEVAVSSAAFLPVDRFAGATGAGSGSLASLLAAGDSTPAGLVARGRRARGAAAAGSSPSDGSGVVVVSVVSPPGLRRPRPPRVPRRVFLPGSSSASGTVPEAWLPVLLVAWHAFAHAGGRCLRPCVGVTCPSFAKH